jgi:hypothetical protein
MKTAMGSFFTERSALFSGPADSVVGANASGPVKVGTAADRVVADACQDGDCDEHNMTVFFDIAKNRVHVCWHSTTEKGLLQPKTVTDLRDAPDADGTSLIALNHDQSVLWQEVSRTADGVWIEVKAPAGSPLDPRSGFVKAVDMAPVLDFWLVNGGDPVALDDGTCDLSQAEKEAKPFSLFDQFKRVDGDPRDAPK